MRWNPIDEDEDEEAEEDHALENRGSSSRLFKHMHPTPRQGHSLIGIDRRCILFGGYGIRRTDIGNEVAIFGSSPAVSEGSALPVVSRGSTSSLSSLHRTPSSFSVASTSAEGSEKDIISEFETESEGTCFNDSYIFDVESRKWSYVEPRTEDGPHGGIPTPRFEHIAFSSGASMFVYGGVDNDGRVLDDMFELNLIDYRWSRILPRSRNRQEWLPPLCGSAACRIGHVAYIIGGSLSADYALPVASFYSMDLRTRIITRIFPRGDIPTPRAGHSVAAVGESIYIFGGVSTTAYENDLYIFDVRTNSILSLGPQELIAPRAYATLAAYGHSLLLYGGFFPTTGPFADAFVANLPNVSTDLLIWRQTTSKISSIPVDSFESETSLADDKDMPGRCKHAWCFLFGERIKLLLFGGIGCHHRFLGDCYMWDIGSSWSHIGDEWVHDVTGEIRVPIHRKEVEPKTAGRPLFRKSATVAGNLSLPLSSLRGKSVSHPVSPRRDSEDSDSSNVHDFLDSSDSTCATSSTSRHRAFDYKSTFAISARGDRGWSSFISKDARLDFQLESVAEKHKRSSLFYLSDGDELDLATESPRSSSESDGDIENQSSPKKKSKNRRQRPHKMERLNPRRDHRRLELVDQHVDELLLQLSPHHRKSLSEHDIQSRLHYLQSIRASLDVGSAYLNAPGYKSSQNDACEEMKASPPRTYSDNNRSFSPPPTNSPVPTPVQLDHRNLLHARHNHHIHPELQEIAKLAERFLSSARLNRKSSQSLRGSIGRRASLPVNMKPLTIEVEENTITDISPSSSNTAAAEEDIS